MIRMLVEKSVLDRGAWVIANGRGSSTMFATWSVSLKFSHWKYHLNVLHAEHNLLQVNFELATAHCCRAMYRPGLSHYKVMLAGHEEKILSRHVHY
jgi:hypothetical protein